MQKEIKINERCYPDIAQKRVLKDHLARYDFAARFVLGKRVGDIGCGEGYGTKTLTDAQALSVVGMDNDPAIIESAKNKYRGVRFVSGDAVKTNFPDESFDVVTCFEVWHHLDEYERFIPEMRRILKPGGLLICSVPNRHVIYLNPFHRNMLTEFYRKDFDKKTIEQHLCGFLEIESWYGQRFVRQWFTNPLVRFFFLTISYVSKKVALRVDRAYKLANGPEVQPLSGENARIFVFLARRPF